MCVCVCVCVCAFVGVSVWYMYDVCTYTLVNSCLCTWLVLVVCIILYVDIPL